MGANSSMNLALIAMYEIPNSSRRRRSVSAICGGVPMRKAIPPAAAIARGSPRDHVRYPLGHGVRAFGYGGDVDV
jgi:hypothetical protein